MGCIVFGIWFIAMFVGIFFPEGSVASNVGLIVTAIISVCWLAWCIISGFKGTTAHQLWEGFLDYLAETFEILKFVGVFLLIAIFLYLAFVSQGDI